jgi:hypothetical protein
MNKYQKMANLKVIVQIIVVWTFLSCNQTINKDESSKLAITENTAENIIQSNDKSNQIKKQLKAKGINSYYQQDTLYIYTIDDTLIAKKYLAPSLLNPDFNSIIDTSYSIEQQITKDYLYTCLYAGDATPYRAYLIDLQTKKIIVENNSYQFYLGTSANGLYHLFETGTSGSVRVIAVYNSNNELLKETGYYASIENQLKWLGNEFYYYSDIDERFSNKRSSWSSKTSLITVQKFLWKDNKTIPLNEFAEAFIE